MLRLKASAGDTWARWVPGSGGWRGYAQLHLARENAWGELLVDPAARRRGLGRHLLGACLEGARRHGARHLDVWCFGDRESGARLGARMGFQPLRRLMFQSRSLDSLPPLNPSGVVMEPFQPEDVADWLRLHTGTWGEQSFRLRLEEPWFDPSLLRFARCEGRTLGYLWLKHSPLQTEGELFMTAVAPEARGKGLGRWMVTWGLHELAWRRASSASVFVSSTSEAACKLYASLGFTTHSTDCCYRHELA